MKKFASYFILTAFMLAAVAACDRYSDGYGYDPSYYRTSSEYMTLRNFSSDTTVWFVPEKQYADALPDSLTEWQRISVYRIAPHSSFILTYDSSDSYVTPEETYGPEDSFTIYVFKSRDWNMYPWKTLVSGQKWVGKVSMTVEEAAGLNNIVTYPMR